MKKLLSLLLALALLASLFVPTALADEITLRAAEKDEPLVGEMQSTVDEANAVWSYTT